MPTHRAQRRPCLLVASMALNECGWRFAFKYEAHFMYKTHSLSAAVNAADGLTLGRLGSCATWGTSSRNSQQRSEQWTFFCTYFLPWRCQLHRTTNIYHSSFPPAFLPLHWPHACRPDEKRWRSEMLQWVLRTISNQSKRSGGSNMRTFGQKPINAMRTAPHHEAMTIALEMVAAALHLTSLLCSLL